MRGVPMPGRALMGNLPMDLCQGMSGLPSMARARHGTRQRPVGFPYLTQRVSQWQRCVDIMPVVAREKLCQPKIKRCGVTRLASDHRLILTEAGEHDFHTTGRQPLDRQRFDGATDLPGVVDSRPAAGAHDQASLPYP